jgi:O-antigen biosynthesis protein
MAPEVSVLIATRNRPVSLERAIRSVLASEYSSFEIVVVDNAPDCTDTELLIGTVFGSDGRVRFVHEPIAGLARAHNTGLRVVASPYVAITDDDVVVDPGWLTHIMNAFATTDQVVCVTGAIRAAELDTPAQRWAEQHLGFHKGEQRTTFDLGEHRPRNPLFPYVAGSLGSGANMSFRTSFLREIGGFDPALGAGSKARGGDDLAAFFEAIVRGYSLVYEPAALVHHFHHRTFEQLERQVSGYGVGLGAFLTKVVVDRPSRLFPLALRLGSGIRHLYMMRDRQPGPEGSDFDSRFSVLQRRERIATLSGPLAYARSRWATSRALPGGTT